MTDAERDRKMDMIERAVATLMEHFDAIQIFASHSDREPNNGSVTTSYPFGLGNFYCRYGMVREWILQMDNESLSRSCSEEDWDH